MVSRTIMKTVLPENHYEIGPSNHLGKPLWNRSVKPLWKSVMKIVQNRYENGPTTSAVFSLWKMSYEKSLWKRSFLLEPQIIMKTVFLNDFIKIIDEFLGPIS